MPNRKYLTIGKTQEDVRKIHKIRKIIQAEEAELNKALKTLRNAVSAYGEFLFELESELALAHARKKGERVAQRQVLKCKASLIKTKLDIVEIELEAGRRENTPKARNERDALTRELAGTLRQLSLLENNSRKRTTKNKRKKTKLSLQKN